MRAPLANLLAEEESENIDLTPMLDVVFIMLIFFIVTASFVKEAGIDVNRPEAATAVKKERANILVAISDKGEIWINKRRVDIRAVQANIERLKAENPQGPWEEIAASRPYRGYYQEKGSIFRIGRIYYFRVFLTRGGDQTKPTKPMEVLITD